MPASNAGPIRTAAPGPVLSLGAARTFLIRSVDGGRSIRLTPNAGDLIVMGGRAQKDWRHMMVQADSPKRAADQCEFQEQRTGTKR
jgi:alkylated DNA repair dioxygenase AlkB